MLTDLPLQSTSVDYEDHPPVYPETPRLLQGPQQSEEPPPAYPEQVLPSAPLPVPEEQPVQPKILCEIKGQVLVRHWFIFKVYLILSTMWAAVTGTIGALAML